MSCIFCKIAAGEIPSEQVAQNARAFAFLDIQPLQKGHVLVIPKRHAERVADMPAEDAADVMHLAQDVARRLARAAGAEGFTMAWNDGRAGGQEVPHTHLHVVPRRTGDAFGPVHALFRERPSVTKEELRALGDALRA